MNYSEKKIEELKRKRKWKQISENLNDKKYNEEENEEGFLFIFFLFY